MPWSSKDAQRFTKRATSPKKKKLWASTANAALKAGATDGEAIRKANGTIRDYAKKSK